MGLAQLASFKIPEVNKILCIHNLRIGNICICLFVLLIDIFSIISVVPLIPGTKNFVEYSKKCYPFKMTIEESAYFAAMGAVFVIVCSTLSAIFSIMFLKGIYKWETHLMLPYIILYGMPGAVYFFFAILNIFLIIFHYKYTHYILWYSLITGIIGIICSYISISAYSLYKEIERKNIQNNPCYVQRHSRRNVV